MNEEKLKALNSTVAMIEKQYGKGAIMKLGDVSVNTDLDVIPTGCLSLDLALGVGGAEARRRCRFHRCRARSRRSLRKESRRKY